MKLAVTGSRHWRDVNLLWETLSGIEPSPVVIIHGGAFGIDSMAANWASENRIVCAEVRPVDEHVPRHYLDRNTIIVDLADKVIAFRAEGKSNGTDDTIRKAEAAGKLLRIVKEK